MELPRVVFFGRTGEEACRFFNLDLKQWQGKQVLDCASGPGSFTALARDAGIEVLAVDPLYALPEEELEWRSREDVAFTIEHLVRSATPRPGFDLDGYRQGKLSALERFLADRQLHPESYRAGALPDLGLPDASFDLVISGHLLFSYAPVVEGGLHEPSSFDLAWHRRALEKLLRVCRGELRLYPAHTISTPARLHPYVAPLLADLPPGWSATLEETSYDQGFNGEMPMLRIQRQRIGTASVDGP